MIPFPFLHGFFVRRGLRPSGVLSGGLALSEPMLIQTDLICDGL